MSDVRYEIRLARVDEIALLGAIEDAAAELFAGTTLADSIPDGTASPADLAAAQRAGMLWVAVAPDDAPVGFAYTRWLGDEPHLEELDVHPEHGRRGLGAQLVRAFLSWARSRGATGVTLSTFRDIPWNEPFYARLGFRALAAAELTAPMRELIASETRKGLPANRRVLMRLALEKKGDGPQVDGLWTGGTRLAEVWPQTPRVTLRAAERGDVAFLSTLLRAAIGPSFVETIDVATHQVIEVGGRAVGCLSVEEFIDRVALNRIFLLPDAQRRGVGSELICAVRDRAHGRGLPLVLTVQRGNPARALYVRLGFSVVSETSTHYGMEAAPPEPIAQ
jgi:GNAT superfamily N-acetyltransferase